MRVLIDGVAVGEEAATVSVFDWGVQRGFGVFEVIRSYGGEPFRLEAHLERLHRSAAALHIDPPSIADLSSWVRTQAAAGGDVLVRVMLTGGSRDEQVPTPSRAIVLWEPIPSVPDRLKILPTAAPWHPGTDGAGFAGVKWLSYAPNMTCTDKARRAGFHDALLLSTDGHVLEGPTFTVAWTIDGMMETPSLELGILPSITREVLFECADRLGVAVKPGRFPLDRILHADEVLALSTVKEVTPVDTIGELDVPVGGLGPKLAATYADIVREETAS